MLQLNNVLITKKMHLPMLALKAYLPSTLTLVAVVGWPMLFDPQVSQQHGGLQLGKRSVLPSWPNLILSFSCHKSSVFSCKMKTANFPPSKDWDKCSRLLEKLSADFSSSNINKGAKSTTWHVPTNQIWWFSYYHRDRKIYINVFGDGFGQ